MQIGDGCMEHLSVAQNEVPQVPQVVGVLLFFLHSFDLSKKVSNFETDLFVSVRLPHVKALLLNPLPVFRCGL